MSLAHFKSKDELLKFAQVFFDNRTDTFRKDIRVCLTTKEGRDHAYFPALIACIAFAGLLSGLHAGRLDYLNLKDLKAYVRKFMSREYTTIRLNLLYEFLRHKIAHLAYPYPVFDTNTKLKTFGLRRRRRRVTWTIYAGKRRPAVEIVYYSKPQQVKKTPTPWPVFFDCRMKISVRSLQEDIIASIYGPSGYLQYLNSSRSARERFAKCMIDYFPQ